MRQITTQASEAFWNGKPYKKSNTQVRTHVHKRGLGGRMLVVELVLHGKVIAWRQHMALMITNCGYFTNVTKERLNGVLSGVNVPSPWTNANSQWPEHLQSQPSIIQHNFEWYIMVDGCRRKWDGKAIGVTDFCAAI